MPQGLADEQRIGPRAAAAPLSMAEPLPTEKPALDDNSFIFILPRPHRNYEATDRADAPLDGPAAAK